MILSAWRAIGRSGARPPAFRITSAMDDLTAHPTRSGAGTDDDPRPAEPIEPDLNECCGNGCDPCVFDTYAQARRTWEQAVVEWDLRHPQNDHR